MTHPLSIKFKPATTIRYGWSGIAETMEGILATWKESPDLRKVLREAMLHIYTADESFREALDSISATDINAKSLELNDVNETDAMTYKEELQNLQHDAFVLRNLDPKTIFQLMIQAIGKDGNVSHVLPGKDGGPNLDRVVKLARYNENYKELAVFMRSLYEQGRMQPTSLSGRPSFLHPVKFVGWGGPRSTGQSFSFLPETFAGGYVEIECDIWGAGKYHQPDINEDWSSGVKVVKTKNRSIVLELDGTSIKEQIPISGKMVPATECGEYVASTWEKGEFTINIYYKSKDGDKRICLYSYSFCCK